MHERRVSSSVQFPDHLGGGGIAQFDAHLSPKDPSEGGGKSKLKLRRANAPSLSRHSHVLPDV